MKQYRWKIANILLLWGGIFIGLNGCKEEEERFPQFETPAWSIDATQHSVNMTAVVQLPQQWAQYAQSGDRLAAFAGENCRGVGEVVGDNPAVYYVTIHGTSEEQVQIKFRYYNARTRYLFDSGELFPFEVDKVYGTSDAPEILSSLSIVKQ
jgi:hypothetical protein